MKKAVSFNSPAKKIIFCALLTVAMVAAAALLTKVTGHAGTVNKEISNYQNKGITSKIIVKDNAGHRVSPEQVDPSSYKGYVFRVKETAPKSLINEAAQKKTGGHVSAIGGDGLYEADRLEDVDKFLNEKYIDYIEPDYLVKLSQVDEKSNSATPDDPDYNDGQQWNLEQMNVAGAWQKDTYGQPQFDRKGNVKIAVIDSGLYGSGGNQPQHEDIDYSHVLEGQNFVDGQEGTPDNKGHGTFVAGLIFAESNNGTGIAGIMPEVDILPLKVFGTSNYTENSMVEKGIYEAIDADVDVINMSLGGEDNSESMKTACDTAAADNILVVAAAGNDGVEINNYPAAYDSVIGVASTDKDEETSYFSQYGESVFCAAPGGDVHSLGNSNTEGQKYSTASGTSFSSPEVAAMAGMVKSIMPQADLDDFKDIIQKTSRDKGDPGFDSHYGWGIVDFGSAVAKVMETVDLPIYHLTFNASDENGNVVTGASIQLRTAEEVTWKDDPENKITAGTWPKGQYISAETDGSYTLHKGHYEYTISKNGYWPVSGDLATFMAEQTKNVVLEHTYSINAEPRDSEGQLIDDVKIELTRTSDKLKAELVRTSDGGYTKAVPAGTYNYTAEADGYETSRGVLEVKADGSNNKVIEMFNRSEMSQVTFNCRDKDSGEALSDTEVDVQDSEGETVRPDGDGSYMLVRGRNYTCTVMKAGYEDQMLKHKVADAETDAVDVDMSKVGYTLKIDAVDGAGNILPNAEVVLRDKDGNEVSPFRTNSSKYNVASGTYQYSASCGGYADKKGSVVIDYGSREVKIEMQPVKKAVNIDVRDNSGAEITGAEISLYDETGRLMRPVTAGSYRLVDGKYSCTVEKEGYKPETTAITVDGQQDTATVKLTPEEPGTQSGDYAGGSGTAEDPYLINSEQQLRKLAEKTVITYAKDENAESNRKDVIDGYYRLTRDIQLTSPWTPIGSYESEYNYAIFEGNFDGGGHTISGLDVDSTHACAGFFGIVRDAVISDLRVEGEVTGVSYAGGIVGNVIYDDQGTEIRNCSSSAKVSAGKYAGGIAGYIYSGTSGRSKVRGAVYGCCSTGEVTAENYNAGGICGFAEAVKISNCYNKGTMAGGYNIGGICGSTDTNTYVSNCYNVGATSQTNTGYSYVGKVGGIVGSSDANFSAVYYLSSTANAAIGVDSGASTEYLKALTSSKMKGQQSFVDMLNIAAGTDNGDFVLTDEYPALSWEKAAAEQSYAQSPVISQQPEEIIHEGQKHGVIRCQVEPVSDGGQLTYQWYTNDQKSRKLSSKIDGAAGNVPADGILELTPDTSEIGTAYYYVVVRNTVGGAGVDTHTAKVISDFADVVTERDEKPGAPVITSAGIGDEMSAEAEFYREDAAQVHATATPGENEDSSDVLTYQWYRSKYTNTKGSAVGDGADCTIDTSAAGTWYYYVKVSDTANGMNARSQRLKVTVGSKSRAEEADEAAAREAAQKPGPVSGLRANSDYRSVTLRWKAAENGGQYEIYRSIKKTSGYRKVATAKTTSWKDSTVRTGSRYYYKLRAVNAVQEGEFAGRTFCGEMTQAVKATPSLGRPALRVKAGRRSAKLRWTAVKGAARYEIFRSTKKNRGYRKIAIRKASVKKYTSKRLRKGKRYYFKVRAARKVGGKMVYGPLSKGKTVKSK